MLEKFLKSDQFERLSLEEMKTVKGGAYWFCVCNDNSGGLSVDGSWQDAAGAIGDYCGTVGGSCREYASQAANHSTH